jgi:hypothetical protein
MRNCRAAEQADHTSLYRKLEVEKELLTRYLDKQYKDIMEKFDPLIVRFRRKYTKAFERYALALSNIMTGQAKFFGEGFNG